MLIRSGGVKPKYWGRLGFVLLTSLVGTMCTVHERVILSVIRRRRFGADPSIGPRIDQPTVVIVGYYRSGTTHLHNLMSCDDGFVTPRWYQCLAGQGFVFGWSVLRFVLVPFLGQTRPQDAVGFGPGWPGEDDFALCSWGGCSSLPGRLIFPSRWDDWKRWHGLEGLNEKELNRWRSLMAMFVWKLTRGKKNRSRVVLLKTPSHTARVAELDRLFDGHVKFVHLVREPKAVIDSNIRLHDSLKGHLLEDPLPTQTMRDRIVEEYAQSEAKCDRELSEIDERRWVRVRYQDLRADATGTLKKIYSSLDIDFNDATEAHTRWYLGQLGEYRSNKSAIDIGEVSETEREISAEMIDRYVLDSPTVPAAEVEYIEPAHARFWRGVFVAMGLMVLCSSAWLGVAYGVHATWDSMHLRLIPAVWICGAVIGMGARRAAGSGSRWLGVWAAIMTLVVVFGTAFPVAIINYNFASSEGYSTHDWIYHNSKYAYQGLKSVASMVFVVLGAVTAYRHGAWSGVEPPTNATKRIKANRLME